MLCHDDCAGVVGTSAWENIGNKLNGRGDHWAYRPACTIVFADVPTSSPTIYLEWRRQQTRKNKLEKAKGVKVEGKSKSQKRQGTGVLPATSRSPPR